MLRTLTTIMLTLAFVIAGAATSALILAQDAAKSKASKSFAQALETADADEEAPVLYLGFRTRPAADGSGMLVLNVVYASPCHVAGIEPDDVIVMINGQAVKSADDIVGALAGLEPGDEVMVKYERGVNSTLTQVVVEERHDGMDFALYGINGFVETGEPIVQAVAADTAAEAAGLEEGDMILKINGVKMENLEQITGYLGATRPGDRTVFTVKRGDIAKDLTITAGHR